MNLLSSRMAGSRRVVGSTVRPRVQLMAGSRIADVTCESRRSDSTSPVPTQATGALPCTGIATRRESSFSTVRVVPEFSPRDYRATFAALQAPAAGGALLDLVPARLLCADLFEELARAWTAGPETVPRLGIVVSFERWVTQSEAVLAQMAPVAARGVRVGVFYTEQASDGSLCEWFTRGSIVHNVRGAVATLVARSHPSESWRRVIEELARLARAYAPAHELPALLTEIAALALSCGGAVEAELLAREALLYVPEPPSATRSQILRELGTALLCQGQSAAGRTVLDQAFAMAMQAGAPEIAASARYHSGLCALNQGDYPGAERRLRGAIALLSTGGGRRQHLRALAHHSLAVALLHLGYPEAEEHARTALALRSDPDSQPAEQDRMLLAKLRELRSTGAQTRRCGDSATSEDALAAGAPPLASDADRQGSLGSSGSDLRSFPHGPGEPSEHPASYPAPRRDSRPELDP